MRGVCWVFALIVATTCLVAAPASAFVIASTPQAAALAATKKFAIHEVVAWNRPGVAYILGTCHVLHRKPWLAYNCGFELHGVPSYCHGVLTVAVRRLAAGSYRAQGVKSTYVDDHGC